MWAAQPHRWSSILLPACVCGHDCLFSGRFPACSCGPSSVQQFLCWVYLHWTADGCARYVSHPEELPLTTSSVHLCLLHRFQLTCPSNSHRATCHQSEFPSVQRSSTCPTSSPACSLAPLDQPGVSYLSVCFLDSSTLEDCLKMTSCQLLGGSQ